jgi:Icc-related predicted phosphoesterase
MKVSFISDTHGVCHSKLKIKDSDLIIHAGDVSMRGLKTEVREFLEWFSDQDGEKIFIAGNHDWFFQYKKEEIDELIAEYPSVTYLMDEATEFEGLKIYGSPWQPWFYDWAFNLKRGAEIAEKWAKIPDGLDILVTHGPVYGILDRVQGGELVGCKDLLKTIETVKPKYHVSGHIHEAYGQKQVGETTFFNASVLDRNYKFVNQPFVVEF